MEKQRLAWIDISKGIGIILVVYGHVLRGLHEVKLPMSDGFFKGIDKFIYSFHMPLFFLLSGFFFYTSFVKRGFIKFLENKFQTLLYPYIIWVVLQTLIEVSMSSFTNAKKGLGALNYCLVSPPAQFWFLYALFLISLFNITIFYVFKEKGLYVSLFLSLLLFSFKLTGLSLFSFESTGLSPFEKTLKNFIFFNIGIWMSLQKDKLNEWFGNYTFWGYVLVLFVISEFFLFSPTYNIPVLPVLFSALFGSIIIFLLSSLLPDGNKLGNLFSYLGENSMPIYLGSIIFGSGARIVMSKAMKIQSLSIHIVIGTLVGIIGSLAMFNLCKKTKYLSWLFEYPFTKGV